MRPVRRSESVELVIPALATQTRFNFPDIPQLRADTDKDILVRALEVFTAEDMPVDFNNNPLLTFAQLQQGTLTLYVEGEESIFRMPLIKLHNVQGSTNGSTFEVRQFQNLRVDWTKSYLYFPVPLANAVQQAFIMDVSYLRLFPGTMAKYATQSGCEKGFDLLPTM